MTVDTQDENPIDRLLIIAEELRLCLGDEERAAWLLEAIRRHTEGGVPFDKALGLSGELGRNARFEYLWRERNRHLVKALSHYGSDYRLLAGEIVRFKGRLWDAWQYRAEPAPDWTPARVAIHAAFRVGLKVPATAAGLRKALEN